MGITANVRKRLAVGVAGALLASSLVAGFAPVAADDGGSDGQFVGPGPESLEGRERPITETYLAVTAVMVAPVANFDAAAPSGTDMQVIENLKDKT